MCEKIKLVHSIPRHILAIELKERTSNIEISTFKKYIWGLSISEFSVLIPQIYNFLSFDCEKAWNTMKPVVIVATKRIMPRTIENQIPSIRRVKCRSNSSLNVIIINDG